MTDLPQSASGNAGSRGLAGAEPRHLRVLSLDGGGVRGLSSLLILRRIMYNIQPSDNLHEIEKPCDYFDMICGTSTGGLIAIMLGRLRMGVQETIEAYLNLAKNIFQERSRVLPIPGARTLAALLGSSRFSGNALTDEIQKLVQSKTNDKDALLLDNCDNVCRVFVCATRTANAQPALLRSYRSSSEEGCNATIWQAARATSAAPTFFPPITFGNPPAEYVDGAMNHNNPIRLLMHEVEREWKSRANLACVLSIGTGGSQPKKMGSMGYQVLKACKRLATSAEDIARDFNKAQGNRLKKEGKYFRFNVAHGLHDISLQEWQAFDAMDAATKTYLDDVRNQIKACCNRLSNPSAVLVRSRSTIDSTFAATQLPKTTSPGTFDVPLNSSSYFTGRSGTIAALEEHFLQRPPHGPQKAVLIGLGGIGKTQIALHYFERNRSRYASAVFVQCNSEREAIEAYMRFSAIVVDEELRVTPVSDEDEVIKMLGFSALRRDRAGQSRADADHRIVQAVGSYLGRQQRKFLVILDNADDPGAMNLGRFIPQHSNGDVIITSRDTGARCFGHTFHIDDMSEEEAVTLLGQASKLQLDTQELQDTAKKITEALGYLPLAIDQAGGYLVASTTDIRNFLSTYELHSNSVLSRMPNDGMLGYKYSAFTTWEMSFGRLLSESPESASFLQHLGFIHCKDICEPLFYHDKMLGQGWGLHDDASSFEEPFLLPCKLSLIKRTEKPRTFEIHKVVHLWIKKRLDQKERAYFARGAIVSIAKSLATLNGSSSRTARQDQRRLYPHIEAAWKNMEEYTSSNDDGRELISSLQVVARSFQSQGYYDLAERAFTRLYDASRFTYGAEACETQHAVAELAEIHRRSGDMSKAENLYRMALTGFIAVLGYENEATLRVLHDLAGVLRYSGAHPEAISMYEKALEGRKKTFGQEGLETLETMDALAALYQQLKQFAYAEPLRAFVLQVREKVLGAKHADSLRTAVNMGLLHSSMGNTTKALELFDKAFESRGTLLESQSPSACEALSSIAALYANIGHVKRSEMLYREVLASQQAVLGDQHPDTLWTLNHLSVILFSKERSEAAVTSVENSAAELKRILSDKNLDTLWVYHNLAMIYSFLGRFDEAEELQERVVDGYIYKLGPNHINTLYMLNDLGDCYLRAGKFRMAEDRIRTAYEGKCKHYGATSQYALYSATLLACTLKELGRREEAKRLCVETFNTTLATLGYDHSASWWSMNYLAEFYIEERRWDSAAALYSKLLEMKKKFLGDEHASTLHTKKLLQETERQLRAPNGTPLSEVLERPAKSLPSDFGYRARDDIVQVLC